jgi:hypothetical protein
MCSGKSTMAQCLAGQLNLPRCELDEMRWSYYAEIGYDPAALAPIARAEGIRGVARYWKPFEAYAVERVLADAPAAIVDFGAGHSVYEDATLLSRVQHALAPHPNVILLIPSPDLNEAVALLNARLVALLEEEVGTVDPAVLALNEHFVKHPSNHQLAKHTVITRDKTPEETCEEVLQLLVY